MIVMSAPKILVVDDYENLRNLLATFLTRLDYTVLQAADGKTAIKLAIVEAPKLILLDLVLPDMNGMEVASQLRRIAQFKHTPIIGWTGNPIPRAQVSFKKKSHRLFVKARSAPHLRALIERFIPKPK